MSSGLLAAAVPTGTLAISATDPGPLVGTAEHPGPNGALAFVVVADADDDDEVPELLVPQAATVSAAAAANVGIATSRVREFICASRCDESKNGRCYPLYSLQTNALDSLACELSVSEMAVSCPNGDKGLWVWLFLARATKHPRSSQGVRRLRNLRSHAYPS